MIVFTDLDGTLLDLATYSFAPAKPAIKQLLQRRIPLILCSAKTYREMDPYREALGISDPFIVENGGAVYVPEGYFSFEFEHQRETPDGFWVIELGLPYSEIRKRLEEIRRELGIDFQGFGDLSPEEISELTGLSLEEAERAKAREYDETLVLNHLEASEVEKVLRAIEREGLRWTHGGVFYHVTGPSDKGKAARVLIELYRREHGEIFSIGIGDSRNDEPLLRAVDLPVLVQKPDGSWEALKIPGLKLVEGIGPRGWRRAVEELILPLLSSQATGA